MNKRQHAPPEEMYSAIGKATTAWQSVEDALRDVFSRIVICSIGGSMLNADPRAYFITGTIFYSSTNLRARLDMIEDLIEQTVTDDSLLAEWNTLKNKVNSIYKRRNTLAHSHVWGNEALGLSNIRPSPFAKNTKSMDFQQILEAENSFKATAKRITTFAIAVNKHLVP